MELNYIWKTNLGSTKTSCCKKQQNHLLQKATKPTPFISFAATKQTPFIRVFYFYYYYFFNILVVVWEPLMYHQKNKIKRINLVMSLMLLPLSSCKWKFMFKTLMSGPFVHFLLTLACYLPHSFVSQKTNPQNKNQVPKHQKKKNWCQQALLALIILPFRSYNSYLTITRRSGIWR